MNTITAYLKKNWKHLLIVVIIAIYNALVQAGLIPSNDQALITALLAALGISLTSNSGTGDAIDAAKK